ncbi:MAG: hydroxymethylglutaryl-CoA reductase [Legionellales bacterium]|nr:hydroxymethylglutaryl-CoA reductase [Legionellales bacterium]
MAEFANVPMKTIGPMKIIGQEVNDEIIVPLATYETPLWATTNRGAKVSRQCGGIRATLIDERMCRSIVLEASSAQDAVNVALHLKTQFATLQQLITEKSRFAKLLDIHHQIIGNLLYLRFELSTGDASGHNMVTQAADSIMNWLLSQFTCLKHVSVSGNFCVDKKVSAVNGILGRGKNVVTEILIPRKICHETLKTEPELIVELNLKKNLIGSNIAGSLRSANAHFANMLLAFYIATGQDGANVVEGSQGIVHTEMRQDELYFSATLPNIIVGTVGNGKGLPFVQENLTIMGCHANNAPGINAKRLAIICAGAVLCGELSLMAAQTNPGELMRSHVAMERHGIIEKSTV